MLVGPPSNTHFTSGSCLRTCAAVVGLMRPNLLALGAAMGRPDNLISSSAIGLFGMRMPTVGNPDDTISGIISFFGKTMLSGPGQNFSASFIVHDKKCKMG